MRPSLLCKSLLNVFYKSTYNRQTACSQHRNKKFLQTSYSPDRSVAVFSIAIFLNMCHCLLQRQWMKDSSLTSPGNYCFSTVRFLQARAWFIHHKYWFPTTSLISSGVLLCIKCSLCRVLIYKGTVKLLPKNSAWKQFLGIISSSTVLLEWSSPALPYKMRSQIHAWRKPSKSMLRCRAVQWVYLAVHVMHVCSLHKTPFHSWNCETHFILSWNTCIGRLIQQL